MPDTCCDKYGACARLVLFGFLGAGIALQVLAGLTCNFITYTTTARYSTSDPTGTIGLIYWSPLVGANSSTVPLYTNETCVEYPYGGSNNPYLTASRTALVVALCAAVIATGLILFEVLILRVCCSRLFEGLALMIAVAATGVVFIIFSNNYCHDTYSCDFGTGAIYNVVSCVCYFCAWFLNSCTPKPKPLLRKICCPDKNRDDDEEAPPPSKNNNGVAEHLDDMDDEEPHPEPYDPARFTDASPTSAKADENYAVTGY